MDYDKAIGYLEQGKADKCAGYFKDNGYNLEYGYSLMLSGMLNESARVFETVQSFRSDWALKLISLMKGHFNGTPTYFQIRCFLEIDINLLIKSDQTSYVELIAGAAQAFQNINSESYKFFARVFLKNDYLFQAKAFLDKGAGVCYRDPELHFLYAEFYFMNNDLKSVQRELDICLQVSRNYYPAKSGPYFALNRNAISSCSGLTPAALG